MSTFILLGPIESVHQKNTIEGNKIISYLSPLGKALWGLDTRIQTEITFETPSGNVICQLKKCGEQNPQKTDER